MPDTDVPLCVDPTRFEQIVLNLLYNAAKYTEPGGKVTLTCTVENNALSIRLRDTGIGIDPDNLEEIFLPFTQLRSRKQTGTGLGIGLAITRQLVEMHGGTITASSAGRGKGSEFSVILPILDTEHKGRTAPEEAEALHKRQRTILIVDDNEAAAKALSRLLEFRGHRVYIAHSGKEAVENTRLFKPETVLLDIGLPDLDGYEVARQLRQNGFRHQIIAVTGYGQSDDRVKTREAGFDHHLVKPVSLAEVEGLL
jgi:CheY-like chemotaxis protein